MYYVYILECSDHTYYTGYTTDIACRVKTHNLKKGAKYTRGRLPVTVVYQEAFIHKTYALQREYEIKRMTREQKRQLILQAAQRERSSK